MPYNVGSSKMLRRSCTLNAQDYAQVQFPEEDPHLTLVMTKATSGSNGIRRHYSVDEGGRGNAMNMSKT
jgi:hypothetical protein